MTDLPNSAHSVPSVPAIEEIGGPFALGEWLAAQVGPSFAEPWRTWCSRIPSEGVAPDAGVELRAEDGKLVFTYTGPGSLEPLEISTQGVALLELTYAVRAAAQQSILRPSLVLLPETGAAPVDLPAAEPGLAGLPPSRPDRAGLPTAAFLPPPVFSNPRIADSPAPSAVGLPRLESVVAVPLPGSGPSGPTLPEPARPTGPVLARGDAPVGGLPEPQNAADARAALPDSSDPAAGPKPVAHASTAIVLPEPGVRGPS